MTSPPTLPCILCILCILATLTLLPAPALGADPSTKGTDSGPAAAPDKTPTTEKLAPPAGQSEAPVPPKIARFEDTVRKEPSRVEQLSETRFRVGRVEFDSKTRSITFPAAVNMDTGMLEYALTTETGKVHESLLKTNVHPIDLNVALLLLRYKAAINFFPPEFTPVEKRPPPGTPPTVPDHSNSCDIKLRWKDQGGDFRTARLEDWIFNEATKKTAQRAPWVYTGSESNSTRLWGAQVTGSIVATYTDRLAMLNNPRAGARSDEIWVVAKGVPPVDTPVQVTFVPHENKKGAEPRITGGK